MPIVTSYSKYKGTSQYYAYISSLSPSVWWRLNDPVGSPQAFDSSGNGYTGIVHGGVAFGQPGPLSGIPLDTAASFAGSGHIGNIGALPGPVTSSAFTILGWFLPSSGHYNQALGVATGAVPTNPLQLYVADNPGGSSSAPLFFQVPTGSSTADTMNLGAVSTSVWSMVAVVFDGVNFRGYVNDILAGTVAMPVGYPAGSTLQNLAVGDVFDYLGDAAEVAIFPRALSAAQIATAYALA